MRDFKREEIYLLRRKSKFISLSPGIAILVPKPWIQVRTEDLYKHASCFVDNDLKETSR